MYVAVSTYPGFTILRRFYFSTTLFFCFFQRVQRIVADFARREIQKRLLRVRQNKQSAKKGTLRNTHTDTQKEKQGTLTTRGSSYEHICQKSRVSVCCCRITAASQEALYPPPPLRWRGIAVTSRRVMLRSTPRVVSPSSDEPV